MSQLKHAKLFAAGVGLCIAAASTLANAQPADAARSSATPAPGSAVKTGTLEARGLTFNTGYGNWTIGRVGFSGLVRDGTRVRADRIDIQDVVITSGPQATEIPSIVITGADLPAPLARLLTSGEPVTDLADLLASTVIERMAIDRIIQRNRVVRFDVTHSGFVASGFKDGKVASIRLAGSHASIVGPADTPKKVEVRSGEVRYQDFDVAEMVRIVTGGGSGGAKRLLQRAVVDGIDIISDVFSFRIDRIEVTDVEGRAPTQPLPTAVTDQAAAGKSLNPEQQKRAAAFVAELIRYARIGRYSIEGIRVSVPGQGTFALGGFTIAGFSRRGIDRLELTGFDLNVPGAHGRFERFALEGIDYGAFADALLDAASSGVEPDFSPARIAKLIPRLAALRLARLDVDTPQGPMTLADLRFELQDLGDTTTADYVVSGLSVDVQRLDPNEGTEKLVALGYSTLVANLQTRVRLLRKDRALVVETAGLSLDQVGKIEISARLDNVDVERMLANPMAAEEALDQARVGPIEIRITDLGLAQRFYAATAKDAGVSPDAIRAGLAAEMRSQAINNFGPMLAGKSADAVAAFLQSPGTITARITPAAGQQPLTVGELQKLAPPEAMQRLTVTLEARPK